MGDYICGHAQLNKMSRPPTRAETPRHEHICTAARIPRKRVHSLRDAAESGRGCVTQSGCVALLASSLRFDIHPVSDGG